MPTPTLTSDLITAVQEESYLGSGEDAFTDEQILRFADRVLASELAPFLAGLGNAYYDTLFTLDIVTDTAQYERNLYRLPVRALAALSSVVWLSEDGTYEVELKETSEVARAVRGIATESVQRDGAPRFYFFRGGQVGLSPNPLDGYLRIRYAAAPFIMTSDTTEFGIIDSVTAAAPEKISLEANAPGTWTSSNDYQILTAAEPHVPIEIIDAANVNSISGDDITIFESLHKPWTSSVGLAGKALNANVGDIVIRDFASPIVQVPVEAFPALVTRTVAQLFRARRDHESADKSLQEYNGRLQLLERTLADRNRGQAKKFVNRNSHLHLVGGRFRRRIS